ncbi:MAG: hypothetical protein WBA39_14275 [Rivularia sp. (in: cyanobacteria)]
MSRLKNNSVTAKKGLKIGNLLKRIGKTNGAIAIAFLALFVGACDTTNDTIGTVEPVEDTPGATATGTVETGTPPRGDNVPDATDNIPASAGLPNAELVGENVTVSTKITEIVGPKAFVAYDKESLRGQPILVVTDQPVPPVGTNVEVSGVIGTFDAAVIKRDYDLDFAPDIVKVYENKPYLAAKAMEKVD